mgnify:CR=1 FL=1
MIGYGNSYILAEGNIGGESYSEMGETVKGLTPPEPSESATPKKIQGPGEVIPYKFETGIPLIPGAEKGESLEAMTLPQFAKKLIKAAFLIAGILAFSMIVWGGYEYLTSGGNPTKQQSALQRITYAIIGLILLFAFWIILNTINPDILKTTDLKQGIKENWDGGGNIPPETKTIADALSKHENIQWYPGADRDIQDMKNGTPINVYENDPNGSNPQYNCLDKVEEEAGGFAKTIDPRILKVVATITDPLFFGGGPCGTTYNVGPFISGHNYCDNPHSAHAKGKAVDISLQGGSLKDETACTQALLSRLCPGLSSDDIVKDNCHEESMICSPTVGGVTVQIWNGTCTGEPHLHIQVP